jgi:crossover junction endodeoxyribonuclease RuvC
MIVLGIDPGRTGGLALIDSTDGFIDGIRTPTIQIKNRVMFDWLVASSWFEKAMRPYGFVIPKADCAVVEAVSSMPKQGVASTFTFGRFAGSVEAFAMEHRLGQLLMPPPAKWKRDLGLTSDKQASLDMARLTFGEHELWTVKANDGIAEAALLARWGLRQKFEQKFG